MDHDLFEHMLRVQDVVIDVIEVNLLIFQFHIPTGVCCLVSSFCSAVQPHGFYFVDGHHGQTQADLESSYGFSEAAEMHFDSVLRSAPLGMGAESVDT